MAVKNKKTTEQHNTDILENPEALAGQISKTEEFVAQNKGMVFGVGAVLALIVAGFFGFQYYKSSQNTKAQNEMFQAVHYFESDSLDLALNGDGNNLGFLDIVEEYGISDAANLANFYAGASYLKKGDFESAILYLEDFSSDDLLVQARAYSLIGDAHMEKGDYEKAASFYKKAADYKPNKYFSPRYLLKAALAHEKNNNKEAAIEAYSTIISKYWDSNEFQTAKKYKAKLTLSAS
ncbi:tetratricopeptide repeat protein [Fulvivirga sp. 29W222]|uniref:Tetratricopeptide repeat protein n=1 Tax=Fulvivirga marina TaxID=2494733 RepID=A0A937FXM4_9BACT|nr:tetratricopeptide repeat protein [Fulvivirga marina]MBL6446887.1 tetratricopeptide repeat protein [Fulvivirga marina]